MKRILFIATLALGMTLGMASCDEDNDIFYTIILINETDDHYDVYEKSSGASFHKIGELDPNTSHKFKGFLAGSDVTMEVRFDDGVVYRTRVISGNGNDDVEWVID